MGPQNENAGIWGSDLGFTTRARDDRRLTVLFGDTWASPFAGCQYPGAPNNDLQATLPLERPAMFHPGPPDARSAAAGTTCDLLEYPRANREDPTSWPQIRLFPDPSASARDASLDMSGLRTPIAAFSDGERIFGLFQRFDPVQCDEHADCPSGMECTSDATYDGLPVGECTKLVHLTPDSAPDYCRDLADCVPGSSCEPAQRGVCLSRDPFHIETPGGRAAPDWYRRDPKRALASFVHVGAQIWPDRPADYAVVARFATNRFQNATARTVAYFDPEHPERNDYRHGYHTLLVWGRHSFVENGGAQALPFLLHVPLEELRGAPERGRWRPRFFAGYGGDGRATWSEREADAKPIYGADERVSRVDGSDIEWLEPEFDQVSQMSVSWVEPLSRWVMFYGGDLPAFMVLDPKTGSARKPVHEQWTTGAIHMRIAPHPWGAARLEPEAPEGPTLDGWSSPEPILTPERAAPFLACGVDGPDALPGCVQPDGGSRSLALAGALARAAVQTPSKLLDLTSKCIFGELALSAQDTLSGDPVGRLYAPNIIDEWTQEVTDEGARARGERSAEVYWNVSTWNPYQVVLFKTQLTVRPHGDVQSVTARR